MQMAFSRSLADYGFHKYLDEMKNEEISKLNQIKRAILT